MSALERLGIAVRNGYGWRSVAGALAEVLAALKTICAFLGVVVLLSQVGGCSNAGEQPGLASTAQAASKNGRVDGASSPSPAERRGPPTQYVTQGSGDGNFIAYEYH